jgi:hypothetical protein
MMRVGERNKEVQNTLQEVNFVKCIKLLRIRWYAYSEMMKNEEVLK